MARSWPTGPDQKIFLKAYHAGIVSLHITAVLPEETDLASAESDLAYNLNRARLNLALEQIALKRLQDYDPDLELAVAQALEMERVELINLRRMALISRYDVVNRGEPIYVGDPEALSIFIEETIARYSAFYPVLEALYWRVETKPLASDRLEE